MTAALTPAAAGADLLAELRSLLDRHDGAATLDDVRDLADELTAALRRTRGRLTRLARKAAPKKTETPAESTPADNVEALPPQSDPEILGTTTPRAIAEPEPGRTPPGPAAVPGRARPAARRAAALHIAVAVLALGAHRVTSVARRALAALTRRRNRRAPAMPLPRPGDAPPIAAMRRSPLDVAAGLQARKRQDHSAYEDTVVLWELGTRVHQGLEAAR